MKAYSNFFNKEMLSEFIFGRPIVHEMLGRNHMISDGNVSIQRNRHQKWQIYGKNMTYFFHFYFIEKLMLPLN